jgi:hypothetical protein
MDPHRRRWWGPARHGSAPRETAAARPALTGHRLCYGSEHRRGREVVPHDAKEERREGERQLHRAWRSDATNLRLRGEARA